MGDFLSELVRLGASSDSALSELVLDVEKDAGQTNGKCARLGPIDAGKMLFLATGVIDFQVAVLFKPAVQVNASAESIEAVVGDDQEQGVFVPAPGHRPAYQIVHTSIEVFNHI